MPQTKRVNMSDRVFVNTLNCNLKNYLNKRSPELAAIEFDAACGMVKKEHTIIDKFFEGKTNVPLSDMGNGNTEDYPKLASNPKDTIGRTKVPLSLVPSVLTTEAALAFLEGKLKYGEVNWRAAPVAASVYIDAAMRHMAKFAEGEDRDPVSLVHHLGNAVACFGIIMDATVHGTIIDDRKLSSPKAVHHLNDAMANVDKLMKMYGNVNPVHYKKK